MEIIQPRELFGSDDPRTVAQKTEGFTEALNKSFDAGVRGETEVNIPGLAGAMASNPLAALEKAVADPMLAKSIGADVLASLSSQVSAARTAQADIVKDFTLGSPLSTGYVPFDLEAPAKYLAPRPTPLRNKIPRKKGQGTSHRFKRITGITGSGTGGVGNIHPGIVDTTQTDFANLGSANTNYYNRGTKIAYAGDEKIVPYFQFSLSDQVPWSAQFSGQGFQDIRALSSTSLLFASMLMEERMLLLGRSKASAYTGASGELASPASITPTGTAAAVGTTGYAPITGFTTNVYVKFTATDGAFGETVGSTISAGIGVSTGQYVTVTIPTDIAGAAGYKVYVGTGASAPADTAMFYAGTTGSNTFILQGALPTTGALSAAVTGATASANGYDGILPMLAASSDAYKARLNAKFSASNPSGEFQTAFASLYNNVKADPDEILISAQDRKQMSDLLRNASNNNNYRLQIHQDEAGKIVIGDVVSAILNESTGKTVPMTVHPWMPQGNAAILSYTLPIPDSQVTDVWSVFNVQDYLGVQWPVTQFAYEISSYWYSTFVCYATAWNGLIQGIQAA